MNIDISYGNTIYADNRIARYTEFKFDSLNDLEQFWVSRKEDDEGFIKFSASRASFISGSCCVHCNLI